jgi:uncharacterized protein DUF5670
MPCGTESSTFIEQRLETRVRELSFLAPTELKRDWASNKGFTGYLPQDSPHRLWFSCSWNMSLPGKEFPMLWTIAVLLLILWLLGMVSSYTLGGFIHILLVLAVVAILIRLIQGRSPVL